jgi:hypothetical protein
MLANFAFAVGLYTYHHHKFSTKNFYANPCADKKNVLTLHSQSGITEH